MGKLDGRYAIVTGAAKVGADTRQVLLDLGYTQEQIQAMEASGAVKAQN